MQLPTTSIGPCEISRLTIGGNPFSGFSHQGPERDQEMLDYYTAARIKETLAECEAVGINAACLRTDAHVYRVLREYRNEGGKMHWIAQISPDGATCERRVDQAVANGAVAAYIHGAVVDRLWSEGDLDRIRELVDYIHDKGLPAGLAGHAPEVHLGIYEAGVPADFHVVCFYNCGSLHVGEGAKFDPEDPPKAVEAMREIEKPCMGYKILAAGRVPARQAFKFAFSNIKPIDAVNVGMFTKDNPRMVRENAELVRELVGPD